MCYTYLVYNYDVFLLGRSLLMRDTKIFIMYKISRSNSGGTRCIRPLYQRPLIVWVVKIIMDGMSFILR